MSQLIHVDHLTNLTANASSMKQNKIALALVLIVVLPPRYVRVKLRLLHAVMMLNQSRNDSYNHRKRKKYQRFSIRMDRK
jgi:hypothetical protein